MYIHSALYYFITILSSTTSYVLLAANMEDFRKLAEQFIPDGLAKEILQIYKDTDSDDKVAYPEFRAKSRVNNSPTESNKTKARVKSEQQYDKEILELQSTKRIASKYEKILEDLVDKVRKKLHAELALIAATADILETPDSYDKFLRKTSTKKLPELKSLQTKSNHRHLQGRYIKQSRDDIDLKNLQKDRFENKINSQALDKTYVANTYEVQQSKIMIDQKILLPEIKSGLQPDYDKILADHNQRDRKVNHHIIPTTIIAHSDHSNAYDTSREKPETSKHTQMEKTLYNGPKKTTLEIKNYFDDFSELETTTKVNDFANYEDETTNYNKRKRKSKQNSVENKYANDNINHKNQPLASNKKKHIQPYLEPLKVPKSVADEDEPAVKTKESNTTQVIFANHNSISKYLAPYDTKLDQVETRHSKTEKVTVIPKENDHITGQVKISIPREKYRLRNNEKDDLRSNLHSDISTPVIINGKVVII